VDITTKELQAVFISRIIENNWYVIAGIGAPIPRAGIMLAHLTHCPDLKIVMSDYFVEFLNEEELRDFTSYSDPGLEKNAEYAFSPEIRYETARRIDLMFLGGIQIDKYGNTNLIGIGRDFKSLKLRGGGSIGAPSMASMVKRYIIFSNNHNERTFVDHCDFISTVGWHKGGDSREQLGLPGGGPIYVISPLCIMDFREDTKQMRLKHLMPEVTKEDVLKNTAFELIIPEEISVIPSPSELEIETLRKRVDPKGLLRSRARIS
jgi:glutaconate CoA-transferase subunit B